MPKVSDLYKFIKARQSERVFHEYTNTQILHAINYGITNGTLLYSIDNESNITGMILAEIKENDGVLWILENISGSLAQLKIFAAEIRKRFPHLRVEWKRRGKHKQYNTQRFYEKLGIRI